MSSRPSLVVVGAGVFGASLARHCALAGWDVVLVERVAPGHVRAGSGDESRIIRCCHGADAWHTRSARRAWALWHEIDPGPRRRLGRRVARAPRRRLGGRGRGRPARRGDPVRARRRDASCSRASPSTTCASRSSSPRRGSCAPATRCKTLAAQAVAAGAELVLAEARPDGAAVRPRRRPAPGGRPRRVGLRRVAGAALPGRARRCASPTRTSSTSRAPVAWRTPGVPGWVDYDGAAYGLGDLDGRGVKVSPDVDGPPCDPETLQRVPVPEHERLARALPRAALPGAGRRAARRPPRLPVRDHARHALRHGAAPRPRRARVAAGRRLGPRLQARPGAGRALRALAAGRRGARAALRPGRARGAT